MKRLYFFLLVIICGNACPQQQSPPPLKRLETLAQPHPLDTLLEDLVQLRNSIQIQSRALMPDEIAFSENVNELENAWRQWRNRVQTLQQKAEKGQVEVDKLPLDALEQIRDSLWAQAKNLTHAL